MGPALLAGPMLCFLACLACDVQRGPAAVPPLDLDHPNTTYWVLPIRQPPGSAIESPEACGRCHKQQLDDWRTSAHANANSAGLRAQLINMGAAGAVGCQLCHQPLEQQQAWRERESLAQVRTRSPDAQSLVEDKLTAYSKGSITFATNRDHEGAHAVHGITCAACHLRQGRVHAPPRGHEPPRIEDGNASHLPSVRTPYFESAEFCAECHQFTLRNRAGDKPLQDTYAEWRNSLYGQNNVACVFCHMPGRRHLWRGIHDADMVQGALGVEVGVEQQGADWIVTATLLNQGAGHRLPTYVTPRLEAHLQLLDASDRIVSSATFVIQRNVVPGFPWQELSDTRLKPLEPVSFATRAPLASVRTLHFWIDVDPDHYYRGFYAQQLQSRQGVEAIRLYEEALEETNTRRYRIHEVRRALAKPSGSLTPAPLGLTMSHP